MVSWSVSVLLFASGLIGQLCHLSMIVKSPSAPPSVCVCVRLLLLVTSVSQHLNNAACKMVAGKRLVGLLCDISCVCKEVDKTP